MVFTLNHSVPEISGLLIGVVLASHNRREMTLNCLRSLFNCRLLKGWSIKVVLVDDGSSDGTGQLVREQFPSVIIEHADGTLFWTRAMSRGKSIIASYKPDFFLWLNDDTTLKSDAIVRLISTQRQLSERYKSPIIIGTTIEPSTGQISYGGLISESRIRPFKYKLISNTTEAIRCDAMNGNIVLCPKEVFLIVGNLDPNFEHALGDIDYGLRAVKNGFFLYTAPGFMGYCEKNKTVGKFLDRSLSLVDRWNFMLSPKGLPIRSWYRFTWRHGGLFWFLYFSWPYCRFFLEAISSIIKRSSRLN